MSTSGRVCFALEYLFLPTCPPAPSKALAQPMQDFDHDVEWIRLIGASFALVAASACAREGSEQPTPLNVNCGYSQWSSPLLVASVPERRTPMWFASSAVLDGAPVVAASLYGAEPAREPADRLFIASPGNGIGLPSGTHSFLYPRLVSGRDGSLHLLWGEPSPGQVPAVLDDIMRIPVTSVWHASYTRRRGWSAPTPLLAERRVQWNERGIQISVDKSGVPVLGVLGITDERAEHLHVLTLRDGVWQSDIYTTGLYSVASTVLQSGPPLAAAVIASGPGVPGSNNIVTLSATSDRAEVVRIVDRSTEARIAAGVHSFHTPNGRARLLWLLQSDNTSALRLTMLNVNGVAESFDDVEIAKPVHNIHAVMDDCGVIHVLYEVAGAGEVGYVTWSGSWAEPQQVFQGDSVIASDLQREHGDGTVILSLVVRSPDVQVLVKKKHRLKME